MAPHSGQYIFLVHLLTNHIVHQHKPINFICPFKQLKEHSFYFAAEVCESPLGTPIISPAQAWSYQIWQMELKDSHEDYISKEWMLLFFQEKDTPNPCCCCQ